MPAGLLFRHVGPNEGSRLPAGLLFPTALVQAKDHVHDRNDSAVGALRSGGGGLARPFGGDYECGPNVRHPRCRRDHLRERGSELMRHLATPEGVRGADPARFGGAHARDHRCAPTSLMEENPDKFQGFWHEVSISM